MATYTLTDLVTSFLMGADVFGKQILGWDIKDLGIEVRTNVKAPQALTKLVPDGEPRPYRINDDFNGATATDRQLIAYQAKWDLQLDVEDLRNTYLATLPQLDFNSFVVSEAAKQFLDKVQSDTLYLGVRDGAGSDVEDICNGWGTILAAEITAAAITEVATGAITSANAVTKVELVADAVPTWMKKRGFQILCSYDMLSKYRIHYRTLNGYGFNKSEKGGYQLDGMNATLVPAAFMGTSSRLIATIPGNLVLGTDIDAVQMHPTPYLNYLKTRLMMPFGVEFKDLDALKVNDQA